MTTLLKTAFAAASRLPPDEQDALARWLLEELASEQRWAAAFAQRPELLEQLADEAIAEHRSRVVPPGPDAAELLAAMAADPAIQRELRLIAEESSVADPDGLTER